MSESSEPGSVEELAMRRTGVNGMPILVVLAISLLAGCDEPEARAFRTGNYAPTPQTIKDEDLEAESIVDESPVAPGSMSGDGQVPELSTLDLMINRSFRKDEGNDVADLNRAIQKKEWPVAITILERETLNQPNNARLQYLLAFCNNEYGRLPQAWARCKQARHLDKSKSPEIAMLSGVVAMKKQEFAISMRELEDAEQYGAKFVDVAPLRAECLMGMRRYGQAQTLCNEIIEQVPDSGRCYYLRSVTHLLANELEHAERDVAKADELGIDSKLLQPITERIAQLRQRQKSK